MNQQFNFLCEKTREVGERNDCGVKAVSLCLSAPYEWVWYELVKLGRMRGKGTRIDSILKLVESCGFSCQEIPVQWKTIKDFEKQSISGSFLILVNGGRHVLFAKDGKAIDWTSGGKNRIKKVWRITEINPRKDFLIPDIPKSAVYARD